MHDCFFSAQKKLTIECIQLKIIVSFLLKNTGVKDLLNEEYLQILDKTNLSYVVILLALYISNCSRTNPI